MRVIILQRVIYKNIMLKEIATYARRQLQKSGLLCSSRRRVHDHINGSFEEGKGNCQRAVWEASPRSQGRWPHGSQDKVFPQASFPLGKAPSFPSKDMAFLLCVSLFQSIPFTPRCAWVMRTSVTSQKCHLAVVGSSQGGSVWVPLRECLL